jgi:hypothetical protein
VIGVQTPLNVGGAKFTTVPHWLGVLLTVILAGQVITHWQFASV